MTWTLIAAVVVGALAPVVRTIAWGVPFSLLSIGTVAASFIGAAITVVVTGAATNVLLRASSLDAAEIDLASGVVAASVGLVLMILSARRMRDIRGLSILCQRLSEEDARDKALSALGRLLDRVKKRDPQRHVALVLMATGPLTQTSLWGHARDRLASLDEEALSTEQAVLRNQALATCELQFDRTDAAREAIERIPRPADPAIEVWLVAMEALLLAVSGRSDAASEKLRSQDTSDNPSLEASHRLVRAHIFAARGELDAAQKELEALRRAAGVDGLERVQRPKGPASELATRLIEDCESASSA